MTLLRLIAKSELSRSLEVVRLQHRRDLERGAGWVEMPLALARKYPNAGREWGWQWVFPATRIYLDRETGQRRRRHLHKSVPLRTGSWRPLNLNAYGRFLGLLGVCCSPGGIACGLVGSSACRNPRDGERTRFAAHTLA